MMNYARTLTDAVGHYQQGRLQESLNLCDQILANDPGQLQTLHLAGVVSAALGRYPRAAECLREYLSHRPEDAETWYNLGVVHQQNVELDRSVEAYQQAIRLKPDHLPASVNLAVALEQTQQLEAAETLLNQCIARHPRNTQLILARGSFRARNDRRREAERDFKNALAINPNLSSAHRHLGALKAREGQWEAAVIAYRKSLRLEPASVDARVSLAKALFHQGDLRAFEQAVEELKKIGPEKPDVLNLQAVLSQSQGDMKAAVNALNQAIQADPRSPELHYNLAALHSKSTDAADLAAGEQAARRCLELAPNQADAWHCLGQILVKSGQHDAALEAVGKARALRPEVPSYTLTMGDLLTHQGDLQTALQTYQSYPRLAQEPALLRQLGIAQIKAGETESAIKNLSLSYQLDSSDQRTIAHRAIAMQLAGEHQQAEAFLGLQRHIYPIRPVVPAGFKNMTAFNKQLAHDIENHSLLRWEPIGLAARNGGLTEELLADQTPAILAFEQLLRTQIEMLRQSLEQNPEDPFLHNIPATGYKLNIWATLVRQSGHIDTHIHEESWLSGAYYVKLPKMSEEATDPGGWIEFGRPHAETPMASDTELRLIKPEEGQLLLFPSYLFHRTIPHTSDGIRISISFDLVPAG